MFHRFKSAWICASISLLVGLAALSQVDWNVPLPVHFDIDGNPDRYGHPILALLILPGASLFALLVVSFVRRFDPRQIHTEANNVSLAGIVTMLSLFLLALQVMIVLSVFGLAKMSGLNINLGIGLLFMVIGNYLPKTRSNFYLGIRTPWTLSSESVWRKTHQLGGLLMLVGGALIVVASLVLETRQAFYAMMFIILPASLIPVGYSLVLWLQEQKQDPQN